MEKLKQKDYGNTKTTISQAFVEQYNDFKKHKIPAPNFLIWNETIIKTSEKILIPERGKIICEIIDDLFIDKSINGFDLKFENGFLLLNDGDKISHLRTWSEPQFESKIEYIFNAEKNSFLYVWNMSKIYLENGEIIEGKWMDNSSFQVTLLQRYKKTGK